MKVLRLVQLSSTYPPFTLVAATTRAGLLTSPLRDRFGIVQRLEFYSVTDLTHIVTRSANLMDVPITREGSAEIARRSRGTPRIANRLLRRVRDYAQVKGTGEVTQDMAQRALDMLNVDKDGLDTLDRRYLSMLLERFDGGPGGVEALAAAMAEDSGTLEDVIEPYLIQQGYVMLTNITDTDLTMSIITLDVNGLNIPIYQSFSE